MVSANAGTGRCLSIQAWANSLGVGSLWAEVWPVQVVVDPTVPDDHPWPLCGIDVGDEMTEHLGRASWLFDGSEWVLTRS